MKRGTPHRWASGSSDSSRSWRPTWPSSRSQSALLTPRHHNIILYSLHSFLCQLLKLLVLSGLCCQRSKATDGGEDETCGWALGCWYKVADDLLLMFNINVLILGSNRTEHSYKKNPKLLSQLQYCEENSIPLAVMVGTSLNRELFNLSRLIRLAPLSWRREWSSWETLQPGERT